nr:hypothetical protein [Desulforamulus aquiferis]
MSRIACVDTGDLYICIFDQPHYQGQYQLLKPREKIFLGHCGSMVISLSPIPIEAFRAGQAPSWCWEMSVQRYMWHFSSGYKYV